MLTMEVCPSEIVHAPPERIWRLLTEPHELTQWSGTKLVEGPLHPLSVGDRLVLRSCIMRLSFQVRDAQPFHYLNLDVRLPFGIINHEQIEVTSISTKACRVTFN